MTANSGTVKCAGFPTIDVDRAIPVFHVRCVATMAGVAGAPARGLPGAGGQDVGWVDRSRFTPEDGDEEQPPQQALQQSIFSHTQVLGPSSTSRQPIVTSTCRKAVEMKLKNPLLLHCGAGNNKVRLCPILPSLLGCLHSKSQVFFSCHLRCHARTPDQCLMKFFWRRIM